MIDLILILLIAPLAGIGAVTVGNITGEYIFTKKKKRKEEQNAKV